MNDNDIIKALECQLGLDDSCNCYGCLFREDKSCINASERILEVVKDLINHQKAEIDRQQKYNTNVAFKHYNDAIKEFAERLKESQGKISVMHFVHGTKDYIPVENIDNLVKEMTEGGE